MRREIHEDLNVIENWSSDNSFIFDGRSSEISTNDRQAQEVLVLALHLLHVSMVYINTLMIQRVLVEPRSVDRMETEDLRALAPLIYTHLNPYGRFELDMETRLLLD
jgi:TnpA family transposase